MTTRQLTEAAGLAPATFYRFDPEAPPPVRDIELRDAIQKIAVKWPAYGRPRITAELRRKGWCVNPKRVARLMREDNLLCVRKRKFRLTTDSAHAFRVYPNLLRGRKLRRINQVWVADITYIRLADEFIYLAVILDAYSRRVIGWSLERSLDAGLTLGALRMAIAARGAPAGLIHHSDRGVQYACGAYTELLAEHGIRVSMSRKGNPYDNAAAESFMKTLKHEEVHRVEYRNLAEARRGIKRFLERTYNRERLHSALGYRPPVEFEKLRTKRKSAA
jgi:putative transposase